MKAGRRLSVVRPFVLSQQTVSVLDGTAPLEYLVQCFKVSYCRKVVVLRVHEELPCILGGYRRVTERGELRSSRPFSMLSAKSRPITSMFFAP